MLFFMKLRERGLFKAAMSLIKLLVSISLYFGVMLLGAGVIQVYVISTKLNGHRWPAPRLADTRLAASFARIHARLPTRSTRVHFARFSTHFFRPCRAYSSRADHRCCAATLCARPASRRMTTRTPCSRSSPTASTLSSSRPRRSVTVTWPRLRYVRLRPALCASFFRPGPPTDAAPPARAHRTAAASS